MPHPQATAERKRRGRDKEADMNVKYLAQNKTDPGMKKIE
jgi:hypothetical protein